MLLHSISTRLVWLHLSWAGWATVAALFMVEPKMSAIPSIVTVSLVVSTFLIFKTPLWSLYLLPLPFMIGPIFSYSIGVVRVTAGDLYAVVFIFRTLVLRGVRLKNSWVLFLSLSSFLLILSAAFSVDLGASVVGLVKILQYLLLVRASIILIKQPSDLRNLFTAWVFITTLCAIMMLWNFYNGRPPLISWANDTLDGASMNLERFDVFYRPTFFYANFWIPLGMSLLYSLISVFKKVEYSQFKRVFLSMAIPIILFALLMNNAKSMLFPVFIISGLFVLWVCWQSLTRMNLSQFWLVFVLLVTGATICIFATNLIEIPQRAALLDRFNDFSSLTMRLSVWIAFLPKILTDPVRLLVGWGPQATTRQGYMLQDQNILTGSFGNTEGAFDSTVVGFLAEYGVIFSALIFSYIALWLFRTWRYYRLTKNTLTLAILVMSISLVVAHIFQQFGLSPPSLMALQIFAFLPILQQTKRGEF